MVDPSPAGRPIVVVHQDGARFVATTWLPPHGIWRREESAEFPTIDDAMRHATVWAVHDGAMISIISYVTGPKP